MVSLPTELFDIINTHLDISARLSLQLTCRRFKQLVTVPSSICTTHAHEVLLRLKHDQYLELCRAYCEQPQRKLLPCAKCLQLHPKAEFFQVQLAEPHEGRCCKRSGVTVLNPEVQWSWDQILPNDTRLHFNEWAKFRDFESDRPILTFTDPRFIGSSFAYQRHKQRFKRSARRPSNRSQPYRFDSGDRRYEFTPFVWLSARYEIPTVQPRGLDPSTGALTLRDIETIMAEVSMPICSHINTKDSLVSGLLPLRDKSLGPDAVVKASVSWKGNTLTHAKGSSRCGARHCHTRFELSFFPGYWSRFILTIERDLGRIDPEIDPMTNKAWVVQIVPRDPEIDAAARARQRPPWPSMFKTKPKHGECTCKW